MNHAILNSINDITPEPPFVNEAAFGSDEFTNIDSNEVRSLIDSEANMSTEKKTMSGQAKFQRFLTMKGEKTPIYENKVDILVKITNHPG